MASTRSPACRAIEILSLLMVAVLLSFIYLNVSPSPHMLSSLKPKGLSSHTTTTTTITTTTTTPNPIPFPFGHNIFSPNFSSPTTSTHPPHQKRLNPQELYEQYRCYGEKLWAMTQQVYRGEIPVPGRTFTYADLAGAWSRVNNQGAFIPAFDAWSRDTFGRVIRGGEVNSTTMRQDKGYVSASGTLEVSGLTFLLATLATLSSRIVPINTRSDMTHSSSSSPHH
ncbi:MAG: hypothetical protein Q9212_006078 [Teloschistes hypoglaucus]